MRHNKKFNHLGRKSEHREAMLANMACSLIKHKRINTTLAKAKALRKYVEPLLTKSKDDTTHSRRIVFSYLQNKYIVTELFRDVAEKIAMRPGGYTRIIRTGFRLGDAAQMCFIELVDYNADRLKEEKTKKVAKTRRSRRKSDTEAVSATSKEVEKEPIAQATEQVVAEEPAVESVEIKEPEAEAEKA